MDWGAATASRLGEPRLLRLVLLIILVRAMQVCGECMVDYCSTEYTASLDRHKIEGAEYSVAFCNILREFRNCLIASKKQCHSKVLYHTYVTMVKEVSSKHNCTALIGGDRQSSGQARAPPPPHLPGLVAAELPPRSPPSSSSSSSSPSHKTCTFHGKRSFRFCSLFGDPHLKTLYSEYQTCKLKGAWPLLDNPHLAVSVTNEAVMENSPATVTTKITVIIKGRGTFCAEEKTYEAQSADQFLSGSFIDGTNSSGPNGSVMLKLRQVDESHQVAEIYLRYIETHLVIRKVGKYLAFAASLPEEVVLTEGEGLKLCNSGCPKSEQLNFAEDHGDAMPWEEALRRCQESEGLGRDISNKLTDHYLDWCVFDLMTTGELAPGDFTYAAHSAQADVLRFDPESLKNRTTTKLRPRDVNSLSESRGAVNCGTCIERILSLILAAMAVLAK